MYSNKIKRIFILLFFFSSFLWSGGEAFSQNYPVQITSQLQPPFSGYIPDYATAGNQNLKLLVLFTDFTKPTYNIKLKIKISGQNINIQSKNYYYAGPFTVQPGIPIELSGSDLAGLLNTNNLDFSGISLQQYNQQKVVPEGFYNICFTAYDYNNPTPIQVSNESCAFGWMILSDPPFLNLPMCGSTTTTITPQNVIFQWTPMNLTSPNSANNTVYDFELFEIIPGTQSAGNILQTLPPIYSTTTPLTFINYGMTEPVLNIGMQYVWRVRARDVTGRDLFKNNGYSQPCTFYYGSVLSQIDSTTLKLNLQGSVVTHRVLQYSWDSLSLFTSYKLEYRKLGGTNWFPVTTPNKGTVVNNLEPENTYEARVKGIHSEGEGPWSNTVTLTTPAKPVITCGQGILPNAAAAFKPLTNGKVGQIWDIGQFEMIVTQLDNPNNSAGSYSGYGKIEIPFMLGIGLNGKFTNILVNDAMQVVQGKVEIVTQGVDGWISSNTSYQYDDTYIYNGSIDSVYVNGNGQVVVVDSNGNSTTIPNDTNGGLLVQDGNGNQWVVNADGSVTPVTGGGLLPNSSTPLTADEMSILKLAMGKIRNEYTSSKISTLTTTYNTKKTSFDNHITQQRQPYTSQTTVTGDGGYIGYIPLETIPTDAGTTLGLGFKTAEADLNSAKVLYVFSRANNTDAELNFIGQYLFVGSKTYKTYVADELAANKTQAVIANDVAELGIEKLVETVVRKKMSRD